MKKACKILIIDDDPMILRLYGKILSAKGYEVATHSTAVMTLKTVAKHKPHLILIDYQMPLFSGVEAVKLLKSSELYRHIPVIIFSYVQNIAELASEAGADAYLSKSSAPADLLRIVQQLTRRASDVAG